MTAFTAKEIKRHPHNQARVIEIRTAHGTITSPFFMPVGTRAGVNNLTPEELKSANAKIILGGNTYHMLCAPGLDLIEKAGGMHPFMGWSGPMLTDSGGFQIFSLSKNEKLCTIDEEGARFYLPEQNRWLSMTPESSLAAQKIIGADIIMAFDQCTPDDASYDTTVQIMDRTTRWLKQSMAYHAQNPESAYGYPQALFAIIQGGQHLDLRQRAAESVLALNPEGIAIGGESIGFNMPLTLEILKLLVPLFPSDKPRYTMGVGLSPQDLLDVVALGADMFDCVAPTRNARHGALYSGQLKREGNWLRFDSPFPGQRLQIKKQIYAADFDPIMPGCSCATCRQYSRSYLHYLFKQKAPLFTALASIHNIHVMQNLCDTMQHLILTSQDNYE